MINRNVFVKQYEQKTNLFVLCRCEKTTNFSENDASTAISSIAINPVMKCSRLIQERIKGGARKPWNRLTSADV
jgi:hypothetical protein